MLVLVLRILYTSQALVVYRFLQKRDTSVRLVFEFFLIMYQFHISNTNIVNGLHNGMNIDMSSAILASICNDNWY